MEAAPESDQLDSTRSFEEWSLRAEPKSGAFLNALILGDLEAAFVTDPAALSDNLAETSLTVRGGASAGGELTHMLLVLNESTFQGEEHV